jgi:hypothetical protein
MLHKQNKIIWLLSNTITLILFIFVWIVIIIYEFVENGNPVFYIIILGSYIFSSIIIHSLIKRLFK